MKKENISIIIPIYNVAPYLERCIRSVLKQTYQNLQIILVDDGSTDESASICDFFQKMDARIVVIHKQNGGLVSARKAGLQIATGEYIGYVDGDDWIEPDMYEQMINDMLEYQVDMVETRHYVDAGTESRMGQSKWQKGKYKVNDVIPNMLCDDAFNECCLLPYVWSKLFRSGGVWMLKDLLLQTKKIYIFGAQSRAKTLAGYLQELYPQISVLAYIVNDEEKNEDSIVGVPILHLEKDNVLDKSAPIFIATKSVYHSELKAILKGMGFSCVIPVTVEVDNELRNDYVRAFYKRQNRCFVKLEELRDKDVPNTKLEAAIYMAKSIYDKPLQTSYSQPDYEVAIQVGTALTEERLADCQLLDSKGDNISEKNRQYCELTALYWIWKHATEDIVGLAHYRRHFVLPDKWLALVASQHIDVILPVPTFVSPSISENYRERHDPVDWEYLFEYFKKNLPEDYDIAKKIFDGNLYSPCNMFIMRREILGKLCQWMFPILDAVVEHGGVKEDVYLNRYPGFISERLITLFFAKHKDDYQIVYADKIFLI